jgi:hypothetical protein
VAAPCRSFSYALTQTASGGEIIVLDSAGYGCGLSITQSVSIIAPPGIFGRMTCTGGTAITVNGSGIVVSLEGIGIDGGVTGVLFQGGTLLSLSGLEVNGSGNSTGIAHAAGNGVLAMTGVVLRNNHTCFIAQTESPATPAIATITGTRAEGCYMGFLAHANSAVTISNSTAVGTSQQSGICYAGFITLGDATGPGKLNLDNVVATSCYSGIAAATIPTGGTGTATFANSVVTGCNYGTYGTTPIYSFGNNRVYGNTLQNNASLAPINLE